MKRLEAICSLIPKCDVFADVGCDHGFISKYVLENNLAQKVIATDISAKCLKKAELLLKDYSNIQFICTDGLIGIDTDVAVIAGMGGTTIIEILDRKLNGNPRDTRLLKQNAQTSVQAKDSEQNLTASATATEGVLQQQSLTSTTFILQPQDHAYELRSFLNENGYRIVSDFVTKENNKFYDIMLATQGVQCLEEFQLRLGVFYNLQNDSNALLKERLAREYGKYSGLNDGGKNSDKRAFLKESLLRTGGNLPK